MPLGRDQGRVKNRFQPEVSVGESSRKHEISPRQPQAVADLLQMEIQVGRVVGPFRD